MAVFSLAAVPRDAQSWLALARGCEAAGFDALLVPDHLGRGPAPHLALAAAAAATSSVRLGAYVSNAGIREPAHLAVEVATLDLISGGRAILGIGAGHTPAEWEAVGKSRPSVACRVRRCLQVAQATQALLRGEFVEADTPELVMRARLAGPLPVQEHVPLTLGTANTQLLRWGGAHADVVGLSGLGRTLEDGHSHEVRWRQDQIEAQLEAVRTGAAGRSRVPRLEALVQRVAVTADAGASVAGLREQFELTEEEVLAAPFVLVGTEDEILAKIAACEREWGITRFVVREDAMAQIGGLLPRIPG
ncbi:MAG: LLM class flavin-dependent oxidoreductase [Segniliparus sp.]|uniref:LLM class flavin-dependent oxidoreductase n=1 Tax=Segniliparus sp. TaxID=2804064 RepID=UPI003F3671F3